VVEGFLQRTERIVLVVVYATVAMELVDQKMTLHRHRFREFLNASHRFDKSKGWALFKDYKVPEEWGGMNPKWVRVFSQASSCATNEGSDLPPCSGRVKAARFTHRHHPNPRNLLCHALPILPMEGRTVTRIAQQRGDVDRRREGGPLRRLRGPTACPHVYQVAHRRKIRPRCLDRVHLLPTANAVPMRSRAANIGSQVSSMCIGRAHIRIDNGPRSLATSVS
jgi:hypothetical protein